MMTTMT